MGRMRHDLRAAEDRVGLPHRRPTTRQYRRPKHARVAQAQHPGICPGCGERFERGDRIHPLGGRWGHLRCSRVEGEGRAR